MSLIAQMNRDLEQAQGVGQNSDLPLFAAAEAIQRRRRRGASLLLVSTVLVVPVTLLVMALWVAPESAGLVPSSAVAITATSTIAGEPEQAPLAAVQAVAPMQVSGVFVPQSGAPQAIARPDSVQTGSVRQDSARLGNATQASALKEASAGLGATTASARSEPANPIAQTNLGQTPRALTTSAAQFGEQPVYAADDSARQDSTRQISAPSKSASNSKIEVAASMSRAQASQGDFIKAASAQSDAEFDASLVERAQRALRSGDTGAAREVLQRYVADAVAVTQNLPNSAALYATLLVEDGAHVRAQRILDLQLGLHPRVASLQIAQLRLLLARGRYGTVVQWVASLTEDLQRSARVMEMHAVALQANGDYSAASYVYQQLLGKDVSNARWWMGLAVAFDSNAQASEAKRAYQRALALQNLNIELGNYAQQRVAVL